MTIPNSITDLDENPNNNSPVGTEAVGPNANGYIQALGAFIRQIYDGKIKPLAQFNMNGQQLIGMAQGDTTSSSNQALTGAQVRALAYKVGEVRMWYGATANISSVWGAGWQLADGTNGTPNLLDKFIRAAGSLAAGATGGADSYNLSVAQLPAHAHGVSDPGHTHTVADPGHAHGVADPGHLHTFGLDSVSSPGTGNVVAANHGISAASGSILTNAIGTGVAIMGATANIALNGAVTNIATTNTGSGSSIDNRPAFYTLLFICYTGIGA